MYTQGDSGPKPGGWSAAFRRFVLIIYTMLRTASQFSSHNHFLILFFNCCSESASQPSWDTLPFSKPRNLPQVEVWQHWESFQPSRKWYFQLVEEGGGGTGEMTAC